MDIKQILKLNLELEADIRLLNLRDNEETRELLIDKFNELSRAITTYFNIDGLSIDLNKAAPKYQADKDKDYGPVYNGDDEEAGGYSETEEDTAYKDGIIDDSADDSVSEQTPAEDETEASDELAPEAPGNYSDTYTGTYAQGTSVSTDKTSATSLMKLFTINDKFRFMREIFDNDKHEFESTIEYLSTLDSLGEVHEYLLNDLGWDIEDENIADFISIIANHFNAI